GGTTNPSSCNNSVKYGDRITLKSAHNKFLVAEKDGNANANRPSAGPWETFIIYRVGALSYRGEVRYGQTVTLKSVSNVKYLVAEDDGRLNANRPSSGDWEKFRIIYSSNPGAQGGVVNFSHKISLRSFHNKFLVAEENGRANANRTAIGPWEQWSILDGKGSKPCK
ncbi:MAG: hypothetical protein KDB79_13720, partial [Acidobacteria bacterium]|nr:hypothetical protein [Acidobacteriota bacterium]